MRQRLIIVGAGGHARVVASLGRLAGVWELVGVLDRERPVNPEHVNNVAVIGSFEDAAALYQTGVHDAVVAIGDNDERAMVSARLADLGFSFPILRHPSALIEEDVDLGAGTVVCAGVILSTQVRVGRGAILNTGAIIDHETTVGDFAHVAPGVRVAGRVKIDSGAMVGIGSCVREKISIGKRTIIGAGSVVVEDIPAAVVAYGNPARIARHR